MHILYLHRSPYFYLFFFFRLCSECHLVSDSIELKYRKCSWASGKLEFFWLFIHHFFSPRIAYILVLCLYQMVYSVFLTCSGQLWVGGSASSAPTANYPGSHILNLTLLREDSFVHVMNDAQHPV